MKGVPGAARLLEIRNGAAALPSQLLEIPMEEQRLADPCCGLPILEGGGESIGEDESIGL